MEKRRHKRVYINEKAKIILDNKSYKGYIVNASESGISFMLTSPFQVRDETADHSVVELSLSETERLNCEVVWNKKGSLTGNTIALGMKIINPSNEYRDWINKILISNSHD